MHNNSQINTIIEHIKSKYNTKPELLWPERYPGYAVFRHDNNKKKLLTLSQIENTALRQVQ